MIAALARLLLLFLIASSHAAAFAQAASQQTQPQAEARQGKQHTLSFPAAQGPVDTNAGSIQFIGTATVIIRYAGLTILTDPNFLHKGGHVHLGYGLTAQRLTDPAISFEELPPIDMVLLSHFHGDHFDQLVQEKLDRKMPIVTTPEAVKHLEKLGFTALYGLHTWDILTVQKGEATLQLTSMPGRHGPPGASIVLPEVMGTMLEFGQQGATAYRMYISGDTLVYDDIREIPKRYPDIDLALLHLGGTMILGVMKVTMDGKDGVEMLQIIAPEHAIPIHYNDYDVFKSPIEDFQKEVKAAGLENKITYLKHGESYNFKVHKPK